MQKVYGKYLGDCPGSHPAQVVRTALLVFDLLAKDYRLTCYERRLLECSAWLHDIGHFIGEERHDRHSRYLILHDEGLKDLPPELRGLLALIAGGHRRTPEALKKYPKVSRQRICRLMALLRLADALDYTRQTDEILVSITVRPGRLVLCLRPEVGESFKARLLKRSRLIKKAFGLEPTITHPDARSRRR
jgi:exopolyphosphatase/guanosine-5'-triphosphate,3'-diphosphate pyrophosphatase